MAAEAAPMWWIVGWVTSIVLLLLGWAIGNVYYRGGSDDNHHSATRGERA